MKKTYFLSENGTPVGPHSLEEIQAKLNSKEITWTDYIFEEGSPDWVMMIEHPMISSLMNKMNPVKPKAAPVPFKKVDPLREKAWYLLKEGSNYGPFSQLEVVKMLQDKQIYDFDYIWHDALTAWKQINEVEQFAADSIKKLKESQQVEAEEVFFRRRHSRASYQASLIIHNNKTVFRGKALEIGAGGAGVMIDNSNLNPGQTLFLHFKPGEGVPPFNAVCEIVSKRSIQMQGVGQLQSVYKYGVKFVNITQSTREQIEDFTTVVKAA